MDLRPVAGELLSTIDAVQPFPSREYPFPLNQSLFGEWNAESLRERAENTPAGDLEGQLFTLMALAEAAEASQADRAEYFIGDRELRARLLRVNSTAGWALLLGDGGERMAELAKLLQEELFQVYTLLPEGCSLDVKQGKSFGSRPTSAIYFYQAVVRYGHVYGRVPLGDHHAVSDFVQDHGLSAMFLLKEELTPLEMALFLGGLSLGIPAVVPSSFDIPYGTVLRADSPATMVEAALRLPNLRLRRRLRLQGDLPFNFDYAYTGEEVPEGKAIGGTPASSFVVVNIDRGDGIEVVGDLGPDVGIEIAVGDPRVDVTMTAYLEEFVATLPSYMEGVSASVRDGSLMVRWRADLPFEPQYLGQALYSGLRAHFDIERLKVQIVFDPDRLAEKRLAAASYRTIRKNNLDSASEESESFFYGCIRCHSFALDHTCIVTPERPPQCGARSWMHIKTRAVLSGVDNGGFTSWQGKGAIQPVVNKGRCLDETKAEFEAVNKAVSLLTDGRTRRVFLHSLSQHPHTACSCFQGVAFHIPSVDGIGLIDSGFKGDTPDGRNWDDIANAVAGKQSSGYAPFAREYLRSPKFLRGDGGWSRVVWMTTTLKDKYAPNKDWIATEAEAKSIEELQEFLKVHPAS